MIKDFNSLDELKRGDAKGLEEFYNHLKSSEDMNDVLACLPDTISREYEEEIDLFKKEIRTKTYTTFTKTTQTGILLIFFMVSLVFTSCNENKRDEVAKKEEIVEKKDIISDDVKPKYAAVEFDRKEFINIDTLSTAQIKSLLLDYITRAELDPTEKRRLKQRLNDSRNKSIDNSKKDLSRLFATHSPQEIARVLKDLEIFNNTKKPNKHNNPPRVVYGGVDYFKKGGK